MPERRAARAAACGGDAGQLRQVLLIPLDDAFKHTSTGGPFAIGVQRPGSRARVEVRDTGPGNAPRDLPHVFDRCQESPRATLRTMRVSRAFMRRNPAPVDQCRGIARRRWGTSLAG